MPYKKYALVIAIAAVMLSSCQMSYPGADATAIPTKPFAKSLATDEMGQLQDFATGTALAKTAIAGGGPTATATIEGAIPAVTNTPGGNGPTATSTQPGGIVPSTTPIIGGSGEGATPTPTVGVVIGRPATYTLQSGEFPYCIARRFNVDPDELLALSGLTRAQAESLMAGTVLKIPQSGAFPGDRALRPHPTTYTVTSSNETFYSIACLFGDVDPAAIAQANGLALGTPLTIGQPIKIP